MKRKLFSICLLLSVAAGLLAYDFKVGDLCYNITNDTHAPYSVEITYENENTFGSGYAAYFNLPSNLIIPESVTYNKNNYNVTGIGGYAFKGTPWFENQSGLIYIGSVLYAYRGEMPKNTSIVVKDGVTSIGQYAFGNCKALSSITIPNSVTRIGEGAFYGCTGLTSITIPNSVTSIEEGTFYDCSGLTSVTIPNSVTKIGGYAFFDCSGLTSVTCNKYWRVCFL